MSVAANNVGRVVDMYRDMANGTQVPFRPSERPKVSGWTRDHILDRHRGSPASRRKWPGKPKFPGEWSDARIIAAVDLALARPDRPPECFGDAIRFERRVDGQLLRVQVRTDLMPPEIWNAYPVDPEV